MVSNHWRRRRSRQHSTFISLGGSELPDPSPTWGVYERKKPADENSSRSPLFPPAFYAILVMRPPWSSAHAHQNKADVTFSMYLDSVFERTVLCGSQALLRWVCSSPGLVVASRP